MMAPYPERYRAVLDALCDPTAEWWHHRYQGYSAEAEQSLALCHLYFARPLIAEAIAQWEGAAGDLTISIRVVAEEAALERTVSARPRCDDDPEPREGLVPVVVDYDDYEYECRFVFGTWVQEDGSLPIFVVPEAAALRLVAMEAEGLTPGSRSTKRRSRSARRSRAAVPTVRHSK